jgi:hypothetical protein
MQRNAYDCGSCAEFNAGDKLGSPTVGRAITCCTASSIWLPGKSETPVLLLLPLLLQQKSQIVDVEACEFSKHT